MQAHIEGLMRKNRSKQFGWADFGKWVISESVIELKIFSAWCAGSKRPKEA